MPDGYDAAVANIKQEDICRKYYPRLSLCNPADYDSLWNDVVEDMSKAGTDAYLAEVNSQIAALMGK